jgi:Raf kinase inhibitor-like YbhB/YbcL family protein
VVRCALPVLLALALAGLVNGCTQPEPDATPEAVLTMIVTSSGFTDGGMIPRRYTCDGADVSPPLAFAGLPTGTASLALLVEDPDAPRGTFVHWVAWGIDPARASLEEGERAPGTGVNDFGRQGYGGPCPPRGQEHRYLFTAFALSRAIEPRPDATAEELRRSISGAVIAEGRLTGRYARA